MTAAEKPLANTRDQMKTGNRGPSPDAEVWYTPQELTTNTLDFFGDI